MSAGRDLTGFRVGKLTVLERAEPAADGAARWLCQCECGNVKPIRAASLTCCRVTSCGCARFGGMQKRRPPRKKSRKNSRYRVWNPRSCYNVYCPMRNNEAGRGVWSCTNYRRCANRQDWRIGKYGTLDGEI